MLPCDDLIGVINLPLNLLDLSQESGKLYTCLIGHDSDNEKVTNDTARMNLKISAQSSEIFNLKLEMVSFCVSTSSQIFSMCLVQANLFQKRSFLHQLTNNMTT